MAKAVGGGYRRLQMPLRLALGVRGTVAGHRLGALKGGGVNPRDALERGGVPPHPSRAPSLRPATVPLTALPASMAFATDSNRPQPLRQPPPTACLTASGATCEVPSLLMHPWVTPPPPERFPAFPESPDASDLEGRPRCLVQLEFSKTLSDGERPLVDYVQLPAKKYSVLDSNQVQRIDDDTFRVNFGDLKVPGLLRISPTAEVSVEVPESGMAVPGRGRGHGAGGHGAAAAGRWREAVLVAATS